jgi:hypothetical protein
MTVIRPIRLNAFDMAQGPTLAKAGGRHAMLSRQLLELLRAWWREGRRRSLLLSAATRWSRYRPGSATAFP